MLDYDRLQASATKQIKKYGKALVFRKLDLVSTDTAKPWKTNFEPTQYAETFDTFGVYVTVSNLRQYGLLAFANGMNLEDLFAQKAKYLMYSVETEVDLESYHQVVEGSIVYGILAMQTFKPADIPLFGVVAIK